MFGRKTRNRFDKQQRDILMVAGVTDTHAVRLAELSSRVSRLEAELATTERGGMWSVCDMRKIFTQLIDRMGFTLKRRQPWEADIVLVPKNDDLKYGKVPHAEEA